MIYANESVTFETHLFCLLTKQIQVKIKGYILEEQKSFNKVISILLSTFNMLNRYYKT